MEKTIIWPQRKPETKAQPWAIFIKKNKIVPLEQLSPKSDVIKGVVVDICAEDGTTIYRIELARGTRCIVCPVGWETKSFILGLAIATECPVPYTWAHLVKIIGLRSNLVVENFLRDWRPQEARRLDNGIHRLRQKNAVR